jgi:NNP family nitrate/nitrite transporter-like MFS transporter
MAEEIKAGAQSPSWYKWMIVAGCCCAGITAVYSDSVIIPRAVEVMQVYALDVQQFTLIATSGVLLPVILSIFFGGIADKVGPKIVVSVGFVVSIITMIARIWVDSFLPLFLLTMCTTLCGAVENAVASKLLGTWFGTKAGRALGVMAGISLFGSTIGTATGALYPSLDVAFVAPGIVGIVALVFWLIFVKNQPIGTAPIVQENVWKGIGTAFRNKNVWIAALGMAFYMAGNAVNMKFLPAAFGVEYTIDPATAGFIASIFMIGIFLGNVFVPNIALKLGKQKPLLIAITAAAAIMSLINFLAGGMGVLVYVTSIVTGILIGGIQPLLMSAPAMLPDIPDDSRGAANGLLSTVMMLGAFCIPSFVVAPIAGENYLTMFICGSICFIIVLVLSFLLVDFVAIHRDKVSKFDQ